MKNESSPLAKEFYAVYDDYAKNLRAWYIGYGIGGPVIIIGNSDLLKLLIKADKLFPIVIGFLLGVLCQITISIINKYVNWAIYRHEIHIESTNDSKALTWLSNQIWIDITLEVLTVVSFVYSGYSIISAIDKIGI